MPFKNPHPLYTVWPGMKKRCLNPSYKQWKDYGGRGIRVCEEWNDFHRFVEDMGDRPDGYTLERIDNDGDYTPDNCRWATRSDQQKNRRNNVYVDIEGKTYWMRDLVIASGLKHDSVKKRIDAGRTYDEIVSRKRYKRTSTRTHCSKGHALDEANTYVNKQGWRLCRSCHNAKMRRYNAAKAKT